MFMKIPFLSLLSFLIPITAYCQLSEQISPKVFLSVNANIETYFIAEKLAVDHIGNYVFSNKETSFDHQPIVYFGYKEFRSWKDRPVILRISEILKQLRDIQHDNSQQIEYLLYLRQFPKKGFRWPVPNDLSMYNEIQYPGAKALGIELGDSLASFYRQARVGDFLKKNTAFYKGALAEARKYINIKAIPYMEKWYGQQFAGYELYLMPGMPITAGDDNYRAFGPMLTSPKGKVSAMVFSSSIQLPLMKELKDYQHFGFDNAEVTRFLTVHEVGHSFVNPQLAQMKPTILQDSALFTPALAKSLENSYIGNWDVCVIEHLVRLGEIRTAVAMGDEKEANRLRKMHVNEMGFILLPMLEKLAVVYETDHTKYPDFKSFLPVIFESIHRLTPQDIDKLVQKK
jgi:precorrin-6B methylase 1